MGFDLGRTLFGIGLILQPWGAVGPILQPWGAAAIFGGGFLGIVGIIVMLVGVYGLANYYGRNDIFTNMLYAVVVAFTGGVVAIVSFWVAGALVWWVSYGSPLLAFLWGFVAALLVTWAFVVASAYYERRAFLALYEVSGVTNFNSAATLVWLGALTFVVFVGGFLWIVALILAAVGAFRLKPRKELQASGTT